MKTANRFHDNKPPLGDTQQLRAIYCFSIDVLVLPGAWRYPWFYRFYLHILHQVIPQRKKSNKNHHY
jgi:hypothetical protein